MKGGVGLRVIYVDILLFLNFYVTYFLIVGTGCLLHLRINFSRRILGAGCGGAGSLIILAPQLPVLLSAAVKILFSAVIVFASFGFGSIGRFLKTTVVFFLVNCVYAGIMLGVWLFSAPLGMVYNNGVSYFDLPMWAIMAATGSAYLMLRLARFVTDAKTVSDKKYTLEITTEKGALTLTAVPDSGNRLTDFFSGLPVIFCSIDKCAAICPDEVIGQLCSEEISAEYVKGIRLIPCTTVSGGATAVCFKPDKTVISDGKTKKDIDVLIGFTKNGLGNSDYEAIFNPRIL